MRKRLFDVKLGDTFITSYSLNWRQVINDEFSEVKRGTLFIVIDIRDDDENRIRNFTFLTNEGQVFKLAQRYNVLHDDLMPQLLQTVS